MPLHSDSSFHFLVLEETGMALGMAQRDVLEEGK